MKKRRHQLEGKRVTRAAREERAKQAVAGLEFFLSAPGFPGVAADLPKRDELYERANPRGRLLSSTNDLPREVRSFPEIALQHG